MRKKILIGLAASVFLFVGIGVYAGSGWKDFPMSVLFRGKKVVFQKDTTAYVKSGAEIQVDSGGTLDVQGNLTLTNSTITGTDKITATHIADIDRNTELALTDFIVTDGTTASLLTATVSTTDPYIKLDASGGPTIVFPHTSAKYLVQRVRVPLDIDTSAVTDGDWGFRFNLARSGHFATSLGITINAEKSGVDGETSSKEYTLNQADDGLASSPREQVVSSPRESMASVKWIVLKFRRTDSNVGLLEVRRVVSFFNRTQ